MKPRHVGVIAALAIASLGVAACGSSDSSNTTTTAATTTTAMS
jgi:hypothetical protein